MPLFHCQNPACETVDNSALAYTSWSRNAKGLPVLCSLCDPEIGKWHNKFPMSKVMPEGEEDYFKKEEDYFKKYE